MKIEDRKPGTIDPQLLQELFAQQGNGVVPGADLSAEIKEIAPLLRDGNSLSVSNTPKTNTVGTVRNPTGLRSIDEPDCDEAIDLERLIRELEIDSKKDAGKASEESIKTYLAKIKTDHMAQLKNLEISLGLAEEVAKIQRRMAVFAWIMAAIMVVTAIASAVFSGGSTLGLIGAGIALAGAALGIGQQIAQSTGQIDKDAKAYAEKKLKQNPQQSYTDLINDYKSTVSMALSIAGGVLGVVGLVCGIGAVVVAKKAAEAAAKAVEEAVKQAAAAAEAAGGVLTQKMIAEISAQVARETAKQSTGIFARLSDFVTRHAGLQRLGLGLNIGGGAGSAGLGVWTGADQLRDSRLQRELAEWQKRMKEIEKTIDSTEEKVQDESKALKRILQDIEEQVSSFIEGLDSHTNNVNEIFRRMENMA